MLFQGPHGEYHLTNSDGTLYYGSNDVHHADLEITPHICYTISDMIYDMVWYDLWYIWHDVWETLNKCVNRGDYLIIDHALKCSLIS